MKKTVSFILILASILCFAACKKSNGDEADGSGTTAATASVSGTVSTSTTATTASSLTDDLLENEGYTGITENGTMTYTYDWSGYSILSKFPMPKFGKIYSTSKEDKAETVIMIGINVKDSRAYINSLAGEGFSVNASGTDESTDSNGIISFRASDKDGKSIEVVYYQNTTVEGPQLSGYMKVICRIK